MNRLKKISELRDVFERTKQVETLTGYGMHLHHRDKFYKSLAEAWPAIEEELKLSRKVIDACDKHFETGKQNLDKETWDQYHAVRKELEG